jgi:hypothetical protein
MFQRAVRDCCRFAASSGVEVRGFEPLASSVRERTRLIDRPSVLVEGSS